MFWAFEIPLLLADAHFLNQKNPLLLLADLGWCCQQRCLQIAKMWKEDSEKDFVILL
jgi:hypothetical protein